jgi:hypothetical protein
VEENDVPPDDLGDVLTQFEKRLTRLHQTRRLPSEAHEAFRSFKEDVDRRLNGDRRRAVRAGGADRRSDASAAE